VRAGQRDELAAAGQHDRAERLAGEQLPDLRLVRDVVEHHEHAAGGQLGADQCRGLVAGRRRVAVAE
jgi:hypothetical protein